MELRVWQKKYRWSNTELAKKIGVSPASISRIATKAGVPSLLLAKVIVQLTNREVTFEDLGVEEK